MLWSLNSRNTILQDQRSHSLNKSLRLCEYYQYAKSNFSIFPRFSELFAPKTPDFVGDSSVTYLKQGHDILLEGSPETTEIQEGAATIFAVQPPNFIGLAPIPKVLVEVGDEVKAGDPIFFDKKVTEVKFVAPVSGEVIAINRGEKRSISEVVILADKEQKYKANLESLIY